MQLRRALITGRPDDRDLGRAAKQCLGHGQPGAGRPRVPRRDRREHAERGRGGLPVARRPSERGVAEQRAGHREGAGRAGAVGRIGRAVQQRLAVVRRIVETPGRITEPVQGRPQQLPGELDPPSFAGDAAQRDEPVRHAGVVLQHASAGTGHAVPGSPRDPPGGQVGSGQQAGRVPGRGDELGTAEQQPRLGERGDGQAIPGGHHLVVPGRPNPPGPCREQRIGYPGEAPGVRRIGAELEHRAAMLEGSRLGDAEGLRSEPPVVGPEHRPQLPGGPDVEPALLALAVGVERGGEAALGGTQLPDHPRAGVGGHPAGQRRAGPPPQVRVGPGQQGVVVQHLLEVRDDPARVD